VSPLNNRNPDGSLGEREMLGKEGPLGERLDSSLEFYRTSTRLSIKQLDHSLEVSMR